jgi:hypothetical protein
MQMAMMGCTPDSLKAPDYIQWVRDPSNGLVVEKQVGDFVYQLAYKPLDYVLYIDDSAQFRAKANIQQYIGQQYFTLRISHTKYPHELIRLGLTDSQVYGQRIAYCTTLIQDDIALEEGSAVIPCQLAHFERTYNLSNQIVFSLAFPKHIAEKKADSLESKYRYTDKTIIFDDNLFGNGRIMLTIAGNSLRNLPNLES